MSPAAAITGSPGLGAGVGVGVGVGVTVATVTLIVGDVPHLPAASAALAKIVCRPLATVVELQLACHGAAPSHATSTPSTYHFACVTPTASEASAASVTVPETVAPAAGDVTQTVGGVVSLGVAALATRTLTAVEAPQFPAASRAFATIVCCPSATLVEIQLASHGAAPSEATLAPSTYHSTC